VLNQNQIMDQIIYYKKDGYRYGRICSHFGDITKRASAAKIN